MLSDPERRRTYDAFGHEGLRSGGWTPHAAGRLRGHPLRVVRAGRFALRRPVRRAAAPGPPPAATSARWSRSRSPRSSTGAQREVSFESVSTCERCRGNGAEPGTPIRTCETCGGAGQVQQVRRTAFGQLVQTSALPDLRRRRARSPSSRASAATAPGASVASAPGTSTSRPGSSRASGSGSPAPAMRASRAAARRPLRRGRGRRRRALRAPRRGPDLGRCGCRRRWRWWAASSTSRRSTASAR